MTRRMIFTLILLITSIGIHLYLANNHYTLTYGLPTSKSICNLNHTFNCDAVTTSSFGSYFGVSTSIFGGILNFMILLLMSAVAFGFSEKPEHNLRQAQVLAGGAALGSLFFGYISFVVLSSICLFCSALYVLSFIIFGLLWLENRKSPAFSFKQLRSKGFIMLLASFPVLTYIGHNAILSASTQGNTKQMQRVVQSSVNEWTSNPIITLKAKPSLTRGNPSASMRIVKFADFLCGHCKKASYSLDSFVQSHDVYFMYYNYPLDGACNSAIPAGSGVSCRMAAAAECAAEQNKGWELHDLFYAEQDKFRVGSPQAVDELIQSKTKDWNWNHSQLIRCMNSAKTLKNIKAQTKDGGRANVRGTPTIFVNEKKLPQGQYIFVLKKVLSNLLAQ